MEEATSTAIVAKIAVAIAVAIAAAAAACTIVDDGPHEVFLSLLQIHFALNSVPIKLCIAHRCLASALFL